VERRRQRQMCIRDRDSAQMACFLLNEKSSWISGQVFHVDGGMSSLLVNG
jgi:3-oxoacyl-[acyl-carrier protein] reductase